MSLIIALLATCVVYPACFYAFLWSADGDRAKAWKWLAIASAFGSFVQILVNR